MRYGKVVHRPCSSCIENNGNSIEFSLSTWTWSRFKLPWLKSYTQGNLSQTSFKPISTNSSTILTVSTAMESPYKDFSINTSHISRQSILAKISGRSVDNHYGTIFTNISETAIINALLLGLEKALFIMLRISLEQPQGN